MNKTRIAILIPYFGVWPEWIDLYMYSCKKNSTIDFFFFTDCDISSFEGENLHFYQMDFVEYCKLISTRLGVDFKPNKPYKLCDVKPFYGYIHSDLIKEYDFWGFGDIDVVWGDIRSFYTDDLLSQYDVFSTHADRISGHLAIFRNNEKYRNLCFKIKSWKTKLNQEKHTSMDEFLLGQILFPPTKIIVKIYTKVLNKIFGWRNAWEIYYSVYPLIHLIFLSKIRRLYFVEQHTTPILANNDKLYKYESDAWFYKNGTITNNRTAKTYIYLHFMILKKNKFRNYYYWKDDFYKIKKEHINEGVLLNKKGIYPLNSSN